jgi:hypothetical protein
MAKMIAEILDDRYRGVTYGPADPAVAPIKLRYKYRFWKSPEPAWAVVQPRREIVANDMSWIWRHIAVFTEHEDAKNYLKALN